MSSALLLVLVALFHAPLGGGDPRWPLVLLLAVLSVAVVFRQAAVFHPTLLAILVTAIAVVKPLNTTIGALPIVPLLVPLLISSLVARAIPWTRSALRVPRGARIDVMSWAITVATGVVSAGALLLWAAWTDNLGMGASMMRSTAQAPVLPLVLLGIPLFAVLNAATEEAIYRGVLQQSLAMTFSRPVFVVTLQALSFAALHYQSGFPNGIVGYAMVAGYGGVLGYLRHRTGGLVAPFFAHAMADLVIGYVLLFHVL